MELLLVIIVITILASLGLALMAQVQEDASVAATRSRITFIRGILETKLEDYEVRRSPVPLSVIGFMISDERNSLTDKEETFLIHAKTLKRMIVADLIRAEMPDGSFSGRNTSATFDEPVNVIGEFPTPAFAAFLDKLSIDHRAIQPYRYGTDVPLWTRFRASPQQRGWTPVVDSNPYDGIIEDAASRSELLYQILQSIEIDGVPASETLGASATGDSNSNGYPEILDGWGDPIFLQWQAVRMSANERASSVWSSLENSPLCGLSCEHATRVQNFDEYITPVLPSQIRPFLTSERLLRIDGTPTDYQPLF